MLDWTHLLVSPAWAQASSAPVSPPGGSTGSVIMNFLPLFLILGVFYFILIRPQQRKLDEQAKMIKALKRGDRIVTAGGVHGKIVRLEGEDQLVVEIADGVNVKVVRSTVSALAAKTEPAAAKSDEPSSDEKKN